MLMIHTDTATASELVGRICGLLLLNGWNFQRREKTENEDEDNDNGRVLCHVSLVLVLDG